MTKLFNEDAAVSFEFAQSARQGRVVSETPRPTTASRVSELWSKVFTGRRLVFGPSPSVVSEHSDDTQNYDALRMSDGERAAFYLACAVMDARAGIVIVDEPDTFLHPVLMRRLWDELELARQDCRFVYITHNLGLALSRSDAQYVVAKPDGDHQLLEAGSKIPSTVVEDVFGALTLSVTARTLIFCESTEDGPDYNLYASWFSDPEQGVMPAGTSHQVVWSVRALKENDLFQGGSVYGVIDKDNTSDEQIKALGESGLHCLGLNEIENLFCTKETFHLVARHVGVPRTEVDKVFNEFTERTKASIKPVIVTKYALYRLRKVLRGKLAAMLDEVAPNPDRELVFKRLEEAVSASKWDFQPRSQLEKEVVRLEGALEGDWIDLMKVLPGKEVLGIAASTLEMTKRRYVEIVLSALSGTLGKELESEIESALAPHLPPRRLGLAADPIV